jgi:hypothetical protein
MLYPAELRARETIIPVYSTCIPKLERDFSRKDRAEGKQSPLQEVQGPNLR